MNKATILLMLGLVLAAALAGAPPAMTVLTPAGGEDWVIGTQHGIAWTTIRGNPGTAYINLWGYNAANQLIHLGPIAVVNYQAGGYVWKVGQLADKKVGPGRYHIRIVALCPGLPRMEAVTKNAFRLSAFARPRSLQ